MLYKAEERLPGDHMFRGLRSPWCIKFPTKHYQAKSWPCVIICSVTGKYYLTGNPSQLATGKPRVEGMCNRNYNQKASWKLVNEVYGRKKARTVKLKGKNVKERLGSWYDHFSNLRGGNLLADSIDDYIKQIFQKLPQPVHHGRE